MKLIAAQPLIDWLFEMSELGFSTIRVAEMLQRLIDAEDFSATAGVHGHPIIKNRPYVHEWYEECGLLNGVTVYEKRIKTYIDNPTDYCPICRKRLCSRFESYCPNCGAKIEKVR